MSAPNRRSSTPRSALEEIAWPQLDERIVDTLRAAGERRRFEPGDVLFDVDAPGYDFHLIISGSVDVIDRSDDHVVVTIEAGNFVGDLGMLMGQGTFLAAEACEATDAIVVPQQRLLELVATVPEVADVIVASFAARRRLIIEWGEGGLVIVGREADGATVALLEFVSRNRIGHRFVDASDRDAAHEVLASCGLELEALSEGPVVVVGRARALIAPSTLDLARAVGIDLSASDGEVVDVIVVGAGPGGLAAGVYAASEGLSTLVIEDTALGGQAGTSSRIENYLGFSTGISGAELAFQGGIQAVKFGARFAVPHRAVALRSFPDRFEIELADGTCVRGRAVVLACGVTYRRLPLDRLEELEGAGVYYAATELEARFTRGAGAVIVGGGNSAGQAAMFLSRSAGSTYIVVRGDGLSATMSSYLTQRIDADPDITLLTHSEVVELHGTDRLDAVTIRNNQTGETARIDTGALFIMIGAVPNTDWLPDDIEVDDRGFVVTGASSPFATSMPGVFAVGDIRSGSIKRVASAVGEGSVVVSAIHDYLESVTPAAAAEDAATAS